MKKGFRLTCGQRELHLKTTAPVCPLQRAATLDLGTTMFPTSVFIKHVPAGHNKKM